MECRTVRLSDFNLEINQRNHDRVSTSNGLGFWCIASDGEIAQVELDCLKSICIQRGYSAQDYNDAVARTQSRFLKDLTILYDSLIPELIELSDDFKKQLDVLEMLIELVVSDGTVEQSELEFIRFVFQLGQWDTDSIKRAETRLVSIHSKRF